jgi:uncharacterized protein (TIGR00251 family)
MIEVWPHAEGCIVPVRAQPSARRDAVLGERAGALRVAVTAVPEKGKANAALARVLAETLGCKPSQVVLLSGETQREKRFLIRGWSPEQVTERLAVLPDDRR